MDSFALIAGILVLAILVGSLVLLLSSNRYEDTKKRLIFKTICSMMFWFFACTVIVRSGLGLGAEALFMMMGFSLSISGDVFLVFRSEKSFIFGLLSFFLAHVSYSVSFIMRFGFDTGNLICFLIIGALAFSLLNFTGIFKMGEMRIPANLYLLVLSFMLANALAGIDISGEASFYLLINAAGAVLFFSSDLILAYEKFSQRGLRLEKPVLITYYGAQIFLAAGMLSI